jgi:Lon protease-like protein
VALPLHIFEPRYRLMVKRCMESRSPFGVINISGGEIAAIGTIADIREATRYVDGRWDLVTLGTTRFRVVRLDRDAPYLRAEVQILDEPAGGPRAELTAAAERVSAGFVDYLELLRGEAAHEHGDDEDDGDGEDESDDDAGDGYVDEVTAEAIDEALAEDDGSNLSEEVVSEIEKLLLASSAASDSLRDQGEGVEIQISDDEESEPSDETDDLLATAITRLSGAEDPVSLSHIVGGVVQLSNEQRQSLLEAPDAHTRLVALEQHLERERLLLAEGIRPWSADPRALRERRN